MIEVVGTNHRLTRLAERDRLVASKLSPCELAARVRTTLGAQECVVLRTCNRIEVYLTASGPRSCEPARTLLREPVEGADVLSAARTYHYNGMDAVAHHGRLTRTHGSTLLMKTKRRLVGDAQWSHIIDPLGLSCKLRSHLKVSHRYVTNARCARCAPAQGYGGFTAKTTACGSLAEVL